MILKKFILIMFCFAGNSSSRHRSSKARYPANTVGTSRPNRERREPTESNASYSASSLRPSRRSRTPVPGSSSTLSKQQPKIPLSSHGSHRLIVLAVKTFILHLSI